MSKPAATSTEQNTNPYLKDLMGGFALAHGVAIVKQDRVAFAYYAQGELCCKVWQPASLGFLGLPGRLLAFVLTIGKAVLVSQPPPERHLIVAGVLFGIGIYLGLKGWEYFWVLYGLMVLPLLFSSILWNGLAELRRFHGAEHQLIAAAFEGDLDKTPTMPVLSPYCGTNLFAYALPLFFIENFFISLLLLLAFLLLHREVAVRPNHPLARILIGYGYLFQRLTVAQPKDRHLAAARRAMEALV